MLNTKNKSSTKFTYPEERKTNLPQKEEKKHLLEVHH
jgi:hypothetical protein